MARLLNQGATHTDLIACSPPILRTADTTPVTIAGWFNAGTFAATGAGFGNFRSFCCPGLGITGSWPLVLSINDGGSPANPLLSMGTVDVGIRTFTSATTMSINTWYHVLVSNTNAQTQLWQGWLSGVSQGTCNPGGASRPFSATDWMVFGNDKAHLSWLQGAMADCAFWYGAAYAQPVAQALASRSKRPGDFPNGLALWYPLEDNYNIIAKDYSPLHRDAFKSVGGAYITGPPLLKAAPLLASQPNPAAVMQAIAPPVPPPPPPPLTASGFTWQEW
jgi:hypothetical protein